MKRNLYKVLGISQDADPAKIKKAYWKAAKRNHPDVSPGTSKKFREVQEAYDILSDPQKKSVYDGEDLKRPPIRMSSVEPTLASRDPLDFFEHFIFYFQDRWAGHFTEILGDRMKSGSLAAEIILTPEEAEQGGEISVPVSYEILCERCQGGGHFSGFICDQCLGWGKFGKNEEVRLRIPAGVRNGYVERILLRSSGYQEISLTLTFRINHT
jgi:DnaJ-class molecular chaperone